MYINTETNQYPLSASDIRSENPNTSFPSPFVPSSKYQWVFPTPQPTFDPVIEVAIETTPQFTSKGVWEQRWEVAPKFTEYTDDDGVTYTVAEQEAAAIAADTSAKLEALQRTIVERTQARLDAFALTRNYSSILSATTYVDSAITKFAIEGAYAKQTRDSTWATLYEILAEVQAGTRPVPNSYEEIEPELPVLQWQN
jgi:hypothetical protein